MKVSEKWLREWVKTDISTEEMIARFTMAGLEVDSVTPVAGKVSNVVVGEIVSIAPHPDADKLRVCQVAGHAAGILQVVCGAANARQGLKIPFALVGAVLPPKEEGGTALEIKQAKLRGVESNGMLCSARELGMDMPADGLLELPADAPVGKPIQDYLGLDDRILELNVTPNRGDCLSVQGLARELSVLSNTPISSPGLTPVPAIIQDKKRVILEATAHCPRYAGRVIRGINNRVTSPLWLQERLRRSGIRAINPVVDITNYVLLELGQPMHAFDFNKLHGDIKVKTSTGAEHISLLDGQDITLKPGTLVIADDSGPLALAGIMGGQSSSVSPETVDILLESAYFSPLAQAGKAREYGLHTDSSHRFERGVDFTIQEKAIERATSLILATCGGKPGPVVIEQAVDQLPALVPIKLRLGRVKQYLGLEMDVEAISRILVNIGLQPIEKNQDYICVMLASWRFDVRIEADLLEELARIYGYNKLPIKPVTTTIQLKPSPETKASLDSLKTRMCSLGYQEVVTYSFVDPQVQGQFSHGLAGVAIPVQNPISSELGMMRTSLIPGLLTAALHNINRQQDRVRIFETGLRFGQEGERRIQTKHLGMLLYGAREPESWLRKSTQLVDFYDIKGDVESLFPDASSLGFRDEAVAGLHPGQRAGVWYRGQYAGFLGALHPRVQQKLGFDRQVFLAHVDLELLLTASRPKFEEISRFPEVRRDLAFLVGRSVPVSELCISVKSVLDSYLINLKVFDVYSGEGVDPQRKSVALGLTFQAKSRTLTDSEINGYVDRVIQALKTTYQAELRS